MTHIPECDTNVDSLAHSDSTFLGEPCDQLVIQGPKIDLAAGETVVAVDVLVQSLVRPGNTQLGTVHSKCEACVVHS